MTNTYKCAQCGGVTTERGHLCKPEPVVDESSYCGQLAEGNRHVCKPMRAHLDYMCGVCGRPAAAPELVCAPKKMPE